jgi:glycosyltransferase involved in cell wall biosynthesis
MLMIRQLGPGGTERQLAEMARSLDRKRFRVHIGCFHEGVRADELRTEGLPILRLPVTSFMKPNAAGGVWRLGRYLRRHRIRIVHTFDYPLNCFGVPVARAFGVPVVLTSQRAHRALVPRPYGSLLRIVERMATGVVVNSESVRQELLAERHIAPGRVHLCYNGVDTEHFHARNRARLSAVKDAEVVIGVVCVLRPEKDLHTLMRAFADAIHRRPGIRLAVVGSGPELPGLSALARELGVHAQCIFQPMVADVAPWLRSIDVFVLPSRSEALSNALMEAMACGCACIASSVGGNPELIREGENGLLFPPRDVEGLIEKLEMAIADRELRERLGHAAVSEIQQRFSLTKSAALLSEIYDQYLYGAPRGPLKTPALDRS